MPSQSLFPGGLRPTGVGSNNLHCVSQSHSSQYRLRTPDHSPVTAPRNCPMHRRALTECLFLCRLYARPPHIPVPTRSSDEDHWNTGVCHSVVPNPSLSVKVTREVDTLCQCFVNRSLWVISDTRKGNEFVI